MALQIVGGCEDEIQDPYYAGDDCPPEIEHGRVGSVGYAKGSWKKEILDPLLEDLLAAYYADPFVQNGYDNALEALKQAVQQAVTDKNVYLMPATIGTYDGGTPVTGQGYGREVETTTGFNYVLQYNDPNYQKNFRFYNSFIRARNWFVMWATETLFRISDTPVTKTPKDPVTNEVTSEVTWDVEVKFSSKGVQHPKIYADLVEIFSYLPATSGGGTGGLQAPTNLQLGRKTATSFRAAWQASAGGVNPVYDVRKIINGGSATVESTSGTFLEIVGLAPNDTIVVDVRAGENSVQTAYSASATGNSFDTHFEFINGASTDDNTSVNGGVEANTVISDANRKFDFDSIANASGAGQTMAITINGTQEISVTYPSPYNSTPFAYIDSTGTKRFGVFTNGTVAF